jgi:putative oxidoreductase
MLSPIELFALARVLLGLLFAAYGVHKLFRWFGGHGLHAHAYDMASYGIQRARLWARISAILELSGGLMLVFGFLTPLGAAAILVTRLVALLRLNSGKGFWHSRGGYEYNLVLLVLVLLVALAGPGPIALDHWISFPWTYKTFLIVSLSLAALGFVGAMLVIGDRKPHLPHSRQTT